MNNSSSVHEIKIFSDSVVSFQTEKSHGLFSSHVLKPLYTVLLDFVRYTQLQAGQKNGVSCIQVCHILVQKVTFPPGKPMRTHSHKGCPSILLAWCRWFCGATPELSWCNRVNNQVFLTFHILPLLIKKNTFLLYSCDKFIFAGNEISCM